jgi:cytochrome P450
MNHAQFTIPSHVPPELVVDFDYYTFAGGSDDLHLAWKKLHAGPEIFWTPRNEGHWVATRADDIDEIFKNYEQFTSTRGQSIPIKAKPFPFPPVEYDPPDHTEFRRLIVPFFSPKAMQTLEQRARQLSIELIESFLGKGECEFYGDFALQMPIGIFLGLVDLPESDRLGLLELANVVVRSPNMNEVQAAFAKTWAYLAEKIEERRARPGTDLISAMVKGEVFGRALTQQEMLGMGSVALFGGLDTVAATLGFVADFLAHSPGHRQQVIAEPGIIPRAVEELLRRFAVANLARTAARDLQFRGLTIKQGEPILIPSVLGGLDERRFTDPLVVDFARQDALKHLTFGSGAHRCIGSLLARTELKIFLEEWLKRIPDFRLAPDKQRISRSGSVMAIVQLPLSWDRTSFT